MDNTERERLIAREIEDIRRRAAATNPKRWATFGPANKDWLALQEGLYAWIVETQKVDHSIPPVNEKERWRQWVSEIVIRLFPTWTDHQAGQLVAECMRRREKAWFPKAETNYNGSDFFAQKWGNQYAYGNQNTVFPPGWENLYAREKKEYDASRHGEPIRNWWTKGQPKSPPEPETYARKWIDRGRVEAGEYVFERMGDAMDFAIQEKKRIKCLVREKEGEVAEWWYVSGNLASRVVGATATVILSQ